jgi:hypothetical protein
MKKKVMKLQLNRETLHQLDERGLRQAAGAATFRGCETNLSNCFCVTDTPTCATCGSIC